MTASAALTGGDALTSVAEIFALPRGSRMQTRAHLEGTVLGLAESGFAFRDATGCIIVLNDCDNRVKPGDRASLSAVTTIDSIGNLYVRATNVNILSHGKVPDTIHAISTEINSGRYDSLPISVQGVVTDAFRDEIDPQWNWFYLQDIQGRTVVSFRDPSISQQELDAFLDAEIIVTGICNPANHGFRRFIGTRVEIQSRRDIKIVKPAPSDPFDAMLLQSVNDLVYQPNRIIHRQRLAGHVVATWHGSNLFLKTSGGRRIRVHLRHPDRLPPIGTPVTVAGFVQKDAFYVTINEAMLRTESGPVAHDGKIHATTARDILFGETGERHINPDLDGRLIRLKGHVRHVSNLGPDDVQISLDDEGCMVTVLIGDAPPPEIGSVVEATGACLMDVASDEGGTKFGRIKGFSLILRSPDDLKTISRPPWWTPRRLFGVIAALLAVLAAIFAWNRGLQRMVERRSRALLKSEIAKVGAELRIDERTRLAVELHDSLAQNLTGVSLQIAAAQTAHNLDPSASDRHLKTADRMLRSCRTELRRCIWDLRGEALDERDFAEAIRKTLRPVATGASISIRVLVPRQRLSDSTAHAVLRILRELTSNAVHHGKARHVRVAGELSNGKLTFSVKDDGCGFSMDGCPGPDLGHFGLDGIRERLKSLCGTFTIESSPGAGTYARFGFGVAASNEERNALP